MYKASYQEKTDEQADLLELVEEFKNLVVHNDDVNTFDWVIESLMDICGHASEQAEQCSLIIHYKGKASVRNGLLEELSPMREALTDRGINATID